MPVEIVKAEHLVKRYSSYLAVNDISLTVAAGEIFGLLGPNGAGKTTTLEMMEGLRRPDGGRCSISGFDSIREGAQVRERIGISLQAASMPGELPVAELLWLYASFYADPVSVEELLDQFNLREKVRDRVETLSGGQRQRLSLALALIGRPQAVFLDEPTTGLDPQARRSLWDVILKLKAEGRAVILSTHYMEEAERLCDRIAILDHGQVLAAGTPRALIAEHCPESRVEVTMHPAGIAELAPLELEGVTTCHTEEDRLVLHTTRATATITALLAAAASRDLQIQELGMRSPTLEDVFIALTGRRLRD